jgi:hypothetical protein
LPIVFVAARVPIVSSLRPRAEEAAVKRIRQQLSYANVMATIAVFLALGGAAYAATQLPKGSVGTRQLKPAAVTATKIATGVVTGDKVKDGSLDAADLAPGTITTGATGSAGAEGPAGPSGPAGEPGAGLQPATFIDAGLPEPGCAPNKGFVNYEPATTEHVGYYRSPDGLVHLKGTAFQCSPYNGVVFILPAGYRPLENAYFIGQIPSSQTSVNVRISPNGEVFTGLANVEIPVSLDGISFRCGPAGGAGCP